MSNFTTKEILESKLNKAKAAISETYAQIAAIETSNDYAEEVKPMLIEMKREVIAVNEAKIITLINEMNAAKTYNDVSRACR